MTRYWVIAPANYDDKKRFDRCWRYDRKNGVITIGWDIGEKPVSREHLAEKFAQLPPEAKGKSHGLHMLTKFWFDIQPGDFIIARAGRKRIVGIGMILGEAYYDADKGPRTSGSSFRSVEWWNDIEEKWSPRIVFGMQTVYEVSEAKFDEWAHEEYTILPEQHKTDLASEAHYEFVLEKNLEEFIVSNFKVVFKDEIYIYQCEEEEEENVGQQYPTDFGNIDILARDLAGNYVVIELKKDKSSDKAAGQILRYMGWVKEHLCQQDQSVRGIIICHDRDEHLDYALSVVENVEVRLYSVDFKLKPYPESEDRSATDATISALNDLFARDPIARGT